MSAIIGRMVTCDRCGNQIFLKHLGTEQTDGGFTSYDKYEDLPEEWLYETEFGYLCPDCAYQFRSFMTNFIGTRVAPKWKLTVEEKK